jgi:hypothetical protein
MGSQSRSRPAERSFKLYSAKSQKWPHLWARTSPKVGPGATVGTLQQGYPLLLQGSRTRVVIRSCAGETE